jgi:hypothetical protein
MTFGLFKIIFSIGLVTGRLNTAPPALVTWLIDGNNLQCSRSVPNERQTILDELQMIASPDDAKSNDLGRIRNIFVVFDGDDNEIFQHNVESKWFQYVVTDGNGRKEGRADDYIVEHAIPSLKPLHGRIHLVTADKELSKRVRNTGAMKGGSLVHPPKFWTQYLPNLKNANGRTD